MKILSFEEAKICIENKGYTVIDTKPIRFNCKTKLLCQDEEGYFVYVNLDKLLNRKNVKFARFHKSNLYSIENLNIFAIKSGFTARCIDNKYKGAKTTLLFQCQCGGTFYKSPSNFLSHDNHYCKKCLNRTRDKTFDEIKMEIEKLGYYLDVNCDDFKGVSLTNLICHDNDGYKYKIKFDATKRGKRPLKFNICNPFAIDNINLFLSKQNLNFTCVSHCNDDKFEFVCNRCKEIFTKEWKYIYCDTVINGKKTKGRLLCPNCDGRLESFHALVLKQIFLHEHPDTIVEDPSCRNPNTNYIMPTDIVNHRLKIAIEIQSQWHDFEDKKIKDKIKKDFWIEKGYKFYDPDIRDYSILEICQLFFNIDDIPNYVDFDYSNKLNIKKVQQLLNKNCSVLETSKILGVNPYRIYNAIQDKKLYYPDNYIPQNRKPIVQLDIHNNYIAEYDSIVSASQTTGVPANLITSCLNKNRHYTSGFIWLYKKDYNPANIQNIKSRFAKYYVPIAKYDLNGEYIQTFGTVLDAAKDIGLNSQSVYNVIEGKRKSVKGFTYKLI